MPPTSAPTDSPEVLARIQEGLPVVDQIARRMRREFGPTMSVEELVSYGREGLISAARNYDPSHGVPFASWATIRARGAMFDGMRASGHLPRRLYKKLRALEAADSVEDVALEQASTSPASTPEAMDERITAHLATMATAMAVGFLAPSPDADVAQEESSPEVAYGRAELLAHARRAIGNLPEAERKLLERHYFGDVTMDEASRELGLSKSWGSRLHARAIEAVGRELRRERVHR